MRANNLLTLIPAALVVIGTAGCDPIHEPWVNGENDLRQERNRTAQQADQLRQRIAYTQVDR